MNQMLPDDKLWLQQEYEVRMVQDADDRMKSAVEVFHRETERLFAVETVIERDLGFRSPPF